MRKAPLTTVVLVLLAVLTTGAAWANDQIVSTVTDLTHPYSNPPIIQVNGVAQGNIRLVYTVIANQFPCGSFATFNLGLVDQMGAGRQRGVYPADLSLSDTGNGTPVQLAPVPDDFTVTGTGWNDNSTVTVNIDCSALGPPTDGQVIDGQMNEAASLASGGNPHLDTISSIQVHIMLVFPTANACLKLYSFESDQDTFDLLTSVTVIAPHPAVKATNPGAVSVDGMVVNTCAVPQTFDEGINLGAFWQTNPGPSAFGNATFTYTTAGEFDPTNYGLATWGAGSPQGQTLCINNFTLAPGDSFLMRVHSQIISGTLVTSLPTNPQAFPFSASLYTANTHCLGSLLPTSLVSPTNPGTSAMSWSLQH